MAYGHSLPCFVLIRCPIPHNSTGPSPSLILTPPPPPPPASCSHRSAPLWAVARASPPSAAAAHPQPRRRPCARRQRRLAWMATPTARGAPPPHTTGHHIRCRCVAATRARAVVPLQRRGRSRLLRPRPDQQRRRRWRKGGMKRVPPISVSASPHAAAPPRPSRRLRLPPQPAAQPASFCTPFCALSSPAPGAPRSSTPRSDSRSSEQTL